MKDFLLRHKSLTLIWLVVFIIGGYAGYTLFIKSNGNENPYVLSNTKKSDTQTVSDQKEVASAVQVNINEPATDGNLEFTITDVTCNETTIGANQYAMDEAEGTFCRLGVRIKNKSQEQAILPSTQRISVAGDGEYKLDIQATQYAQEDQTVRYWYEQIAPNATVSGDLVFDIPAAMTPEKAYLHSSDGSSGVVINLN